MSVRCTLCHKDLPESEFYPSALQRGQHQCKKCCYQAYGKRNTQKYVESIRQLPERNFDTFYGGYTISILNYAREGEYKYVIRSTDGKCFATNDSDAFMAEVGKIANG